VILVRRSLAEVRTVPVLVVHTVANECARFFNCSLSCALYKRKVKFLTKLKTSENIICKLFVNNTNCELATLHSISPEQLHLSLN